jgi:hypothetical protein
MKAKLRKCRDFLLDHPIALVVGLYVVVLALGTGCMLRPYCKSGHYEAARELKHNHRIGVGDVRRQNEFATSMGFYTAPPPWLAGKYMIARSIPAKSIPAGSDLSAAPLAERADIEVAAKKRVLAFPLPPNWPLLGLLDAGTPVVLVAEGTQTKPAVQVPATVLAIVCQAGKSEAEGCYPVLEIDEAGTEDVLKNQASLRLMLSSQP